MTILQTKLDAIRSDASISSRVRSWVIEATTRIEHTRNVYMDHADRLASLEARIAVLEADDPSPTPSPSPTGQTRVQLPLTLTGLETKSNTHYVGPCNIKGQVVFSGVTNITLENVSITNPGGTAIWMPNCEKITLRDLYVHDSECGIFADGTLFLRADDVEIYDSVITFIYDAADTTRGNGIQTCGKRWKVYDTEISRCNQQGVLIDASTGKGATDFTWTRCRFLDNGWGTYTGGSHGAYAKAPNCHFYDCEFSGNDKNGVSLRWGGAKVIGCYSQPRPHPQPIDCAWFGYATAPPGQVSIMGNRFTGALTCGIYISSEGQDGFSFAINNNSITGRDILTTGINAEVPVAVHTGNMFFQPIGTHERYV